METTDKPLAAAGFTSYRYRGRYGWIMIGAHDDADAMKEAARSGPYTDPAGLEVWDRELGQYRPVIAPGRAHRPIFLQPGGNRI